MMRKVRSALLRMGISAASLWFVFYFAREKLYDAMVYLTGVHLIPVIIALLIYFGSLIVVSYRLQLILSVQGIALPVIRLYYLWVVSLFFNLFLPSAVGGDVAKAYYIYKDSNKKVAAVSSVLMDRFLGLVATIVMGSCAFLIARKQIGTPHVGNLLVWFLSIIVIGLLFVMSRRFSGPAKNLIHLLTPKRFEDKIHKFFEALDLFRKRRKNFVVAFAYAILAQGFFVIMFYCLARSLQIELPVGIFFLVIPLVTIFSMIPSIGGLGVREASTIYLFKSYIPIEQAVALSLMAAVFIYGIGAACGILYAIRGGASVRDEVERMEMIEEGGA